MVYVPSIADTYYPLIDIVNGSAHKALLLMFRYGSSRKIAQSRLCDDADAFWYRLRIVSLYSFVVLAGLFVLSVWAFEVRILMRATTQKEDFVMEGIALIVGILLIAVVVYVAADD